MSKNEIDPQLDVPEDEIDIFKILQALLEKWKLLVVIGIVGLVFGIIASFNIAKQYTGEMKIKVFKQTLNDLTEDKDTKFHILKLEDKIFIEKFQDNLKKQHNLSEDELEVINFGLKPTHDTKKAPGIIFITASSLDEDMTISYLEMLNKKYCELLFDDLDKLRNMKLAALEARKKECFGKMEELENELTKFDSGKILIYNCEKQLKSHDALAKAFAEYRSISKQCELLNQIIPTLDKASAAEICDAFKATCSDLARISIASDNDKVWSIVVEYREKEGRVEFLKSELKQANSAKSNNDKIKLIQDSLNTAEIDLNTFAKITVKQIIARKNLLDKKSLSLLRKIENIQKFQENAHTDFIKYNETKNRYNAMRGSYNSIATKLTQELDQPQVKYYCEVINQPEITKTNLMKRFAILVIFPILLLGMTAFLIIFLNAYKEHWKK